MLRKFLGYAFSPFGILAALPAFIPFGSVFLNLIKLPFYAPIGMIAFINSTSCLFVLFLTYVYALYYKVTRRLLVSFFVLAVASWVGYQLATIPSETIISLGFNVAIAQEFGFHEATILTLYLGIFASLTALFSLLMTPIYRLYS